MTKGWLLDILHWTFGIPPGGLDARREDGDQFPTLAHSGLDLLVRREARAAGEAEPDQGLAQFFEGEPEHVDEVAAGFGTLRLRVVRCGGRAGADQLARDVEADTIARELRDSPGHRGCKAQQSLFEVETHRNVQ